MILSQQNKGGNNAIVFNIYWDDLTEDAQERLIEDGFLPHENLDCMPLSILEIESDVMYDEDEEY